MGKCIKAQPDKLHHARACGAMLESYRSPATGHPPKDMEMAAFMAVFHPNIKGKRLKQVMEAR